MANISSNKQIRWNQFRRTARDILARSRSSCGAADPVGDLARAMERAYAAGAVQVAQPTDSLVVDGGIRWDAIPSRTRTMLEYLGSIVYDYRDDIREGTLLAALEGAAAIGRKGDRVRFSFWISEESDNGRVLHLCETPSIQHEFAATSASALIRMEIFTKIKIDPPTQIAKLTPLGLNTILSAVEAGHIFIPHLHLGSRWPVNPANGADHF
ncbi:hypothetical protein [Sphingopyxis sp. 550A]